MFDKPVLRRKTKVLLVVILVLVTCFYLFKKDHDPSANIPVQLIYTIDGDTAIFLIDGKEETVRFIAIDCPEDTTVKEAWGHEATLRTNSLLSTATTIEIEDEDPVIYDNYGRHVAWVWVNHELLQETLVEDGLAEVTYIYDDYKYVNELKVKEHIAQIYHKGMWSN